MKQIMLVMALVLIFSDTAFSQDNIFNFKIDESGQVIWQKIYETEMDFTGLVSEIKTSGNIQEAEVQGNRLFGDLRRLEFDFRGLGLKRASAPMSLLGNDLLGFVNIDYKEGRYRVIVRNMKYISKLDTPFSKQDQIFDFDEAVTKKGEFRKNFNANHQAEIIDYTLSKTFSLTEIASEDW